MASRGVYRKERVDPLESIASKVFCKALLNFCTTKLEESKETEAIQQIREYLIALGTTTPTYHQLLEKVFRLKGCKINVRAVEVLFNESFKEFRFNADCKDNVRLVRSILPKCASLEYLDLSWLYLECSQTYLYEEILRNCQNLKEIILPETAMNSDWLPLLSTHCSKLCHISMPSIYRAELLVDTNFKSTLKSITFINLDEDFDDDEYVHDDEYVYVQILMRCPNVDFIHPDYPLHGAIEECRLADMNFCCKLKEINIFDTNETRLETLISACPKLSKLSLHSPSNCSLKILSKLESLHSLDITDFDYDDLIQLFKIIGYNLRILQLNSMRKKSVINIVELIKLCPHLTQLKLVDLDVRFERPFNLETCCIALKIFRIRKCTYSKSELVNFLNYLHINLEIFAADEVLFTDEDIERIFCGKSFKNFKKFFVCKATRLTIFSVHTLLHFCPKLEYVGQLLKWKINEEEIKSIPILKANLCSQMYVDLYK